MRACADIPLDEGGKAAVQASHHPKLSASLPADKLADVKSSVKIVGSEVSKLDKAGEHNDPAGVQSHLQALKATLAKVRPYSQH